MLGQDSAVVNLPRPDGVDIILPYFFAAGTVNNTGMGITALPWSEIKAYFELNHIRWRVLAEIIRAMSQAYANAYHAGADASSISPLAEYYGEDASAVRQQMASDQLRAMLLGGA